MGPLRPPGPPGIFGEPVSDVQPSNPGPTSGFSDWFQWTIEKGLDIYRARQGSKSDGTLIKVIPNQSPDPSRMPWFENFARQGEGTPRNPITQNLPLLIGLGFAGLVIILALRR